MPSRIDEFHEGEIAMHQILKVDIRRNPTNPGLPERFTPRLLASPLVAVGTLDTEGRPWTTIWGGERGFARPIAEDVLGLNSIVDRRWDPVYETLWSGHEDGQIVQDDRLMSALSIDLETRDRIKVAGNMIAGTSVAGTGEVQLAMHVRESLGNCPKYLNKKDVKPHGVKDAQLVQGKGLSLNSEAMGVLEQADLFFMSSTNGETMDTNHRGGNRGFVRVMENQEDKLVLVYPEYSGNRLYQTLGNLKVNPLVGMVIPDFGTGNVLYLTGSTEILIGEQASSVIKRSNLAVKVIVTGIRFVKSGLPFRASVIDYSPYNPPIRHLLSEQSANVSSEAVSDLTATLTRREPLTKSTSRFTFKLSSASGRKVSWEAGQHITFDFSYALDTGYAHMNNDDPQSLNDDYVRTFTVSNIPNDEGVVQITARRNGPATGLLWRHDVDNIPLDIPVMGFGGEEAFRMTDARDNVFFAGGVGITPVLAQAGSLIDKGGRLTLLWGLRVEDLGLAVDTFERIPRLASRTKLFVTGDGADKRLRTAVRDIGAEIIERRIQREDVEGLRGGDRKFFLCAAPVVMGKMNEWLEGEEVVWEDFGY